jgi:hypothetical protein
MPAWRAYNRDFAVQLAKFTFNIQIHRVRL